MAQFTMCRFHTLSTHSALVRTTSPECEDNAAKSMNETAHQTKENQEHERAVDSAESEAQKELSKALLTVPKTNATVSKPNNPPVARYDLFSPEVQKLWRQLVREAYDHAMANTDNRLLILLRRFADYPGDLPILPEHVEAFLRNDFELEDNEENRELIAAMKRGLRDVKRKLDGHLSTHDLWNVGRSTAVGSNQVGARWDELVWH